MLSKRVISKIALPIQGSLPAATDQVIVVIGPNCFDLGAYCYGIVSPPLGSRKGLKGPQAQRSVDLTSYVQAQADGVAELIVFLSEQISIGGKRPMTVELYTRNMISFLDWAQRSGLPSIVDKTHDVRPTLASYIDHLWHLFKTNKLSQNSAAMRQNHVLFVLREFAERDDLEHGLNLIRVSSSSCKSTEPASEQDQGRLLALCQCLFDGLGSAALAFTRYPFEIPVPPALQAPNNKLWVFPGPTWCMPPHLAARRESLKMGFWAYDFKNGTLMEPSAIEHRYAPSKQKKLRFGYRAERAVIDGQKVIDQANKNRNDSSRRQLGVNAQHAFLILFLANTAMNWATVVALPWSDEFEVGAERQGFRAIKYRANNRFVSFEIQTVFLPTFKKYLSIRKYVLNGQDYNLLFCAANSRRTEAIPLSEASLDTTFNVLKRLDPGLQSIKSRKWRASKSDWLIRKTDPATAALVLQNSEATVLRSYSAGSPTTQNEELGLFFDSLHSAVLERRNGQSGILFSAVGGCSSFGEPVPSMDSPSVPNCKSLEGCLFCDKHKVHADEIDARKLLSCQYCIVQSQTMIDSQERSMSIIQPIIDRIEAILAEIDRRVPGLVARIRGEVLEGNLDFSGPENCK